MIDADTPLPVAGFVATTPREMLTILRGSGMSDDEILDMIKRIGDETGWTPQLNILGLLILKPDAPEGQEAEA